MIYRLFFLAYIFYIWIQIHFVATATHPEKVLDNTEGFLREMMVLAKFQSNIFAPVVLEFHWFCFYRPDTLSV